jgi:zinc transporter
VACAAYIAGDGPVRKIGAEEAAEYRGPGFVWLHADSLDAPDIASLTRAGDVPEVAAAALVATETRPRCDRIGDGALINLRGPGDRPGNGKDSLVSIRMWVRAGRVNSVTRRPITAMRTVVSQIERGAITDPGDLVAAFAKAISIDLDPRVATLGDRLDDCESELQERQIYRMRAAIARIRADAIGYRRFVSPDRDALLTLAGLGFDWLAEEDRLHIRESADRFARMSEELEAVRERAAILHEQLTDMRAEQIDQRSLYIAVLAFIFLPLTFITGLFGMNVEGIPYARSHWSFWGIAIFCVVTGLGVLGWFARRHWLKR